MRKLILGLIVVSFCGAEASAQSSAMMAMPDVLIYKTKADYRNLVPVMLSPDKSRVISYPDPSDVVGGSSGPAPVQLHKGYLLDKRGVGWNTAFIKLTYEEYGKLKEAPSAEALYGMIVEKNPLTELYDCGRREPMKNSVHRWNDVIDEGKLKKKCTHIKH